MTHILKVTVHQADHLEDVERFGKNDPYARISFGLDGKNTAKTQTLKNAGKEAAWNKTLELPNYNPQEHETLYLEILDEETGFDEPIAFTAIPLHQVLAAQGHALRGRFDLHTVKGKQKGEVLLSIVVVNAGQTEGAHPQSEVRGLVKLDSAQQARINGLVRKEKAGDVGTAALLAGAILGAKALHDSSKDSKKVAHDQQEQAKAENREY
ncbi:MAG: C2 domain-containing protein [Linnemannia elongata]|nr:MAG: C2 domain-containing protein [Linnemannia elongata]